MKEKNIKRCKNGHPIKKCQLLLMRHVVGVCECGNRYLHSEIPGVYIGDKHNKLGETFHTFLFVSMLLCGKCQRYITSIDVVCQPTKEYEKNWRTELADNLTADDVLGEKK